MVDLLLRVLLKASHQLLAGISARTFEAAAPHVPAPSIFADHFDVPSPNGKQWPIVGTGARIRARTPHPPVSTADRTSVGRGHCCIK